VSDIDTAAVDSLKVLDLKWPIREADIRPERRRPVAPPATLTKYSGFSICSYGDGVLACFVWPILVNATAI